MNSRRKGARNERGIANLFSEWTGLKFAKTPASGGLQWRSTFTKGDIVCTKEGHYFPFCIEAKSYSKIDFSHLILMGIKNIEIIKFWEQCTRDAKIVNKVPMLFMRYNGLARDFHYLVVPSDFYSRIKTEFTNKVKRLVYQGDSYKFTILGSPDFFKLDYKKIKSHAKSYCRKGQ